MCPVTHQAMSHAEGRLLSTTLVITRSEVNDPTTKVCAVGCFAMRRAARGELSQRPLNGAAVNYAFIDHFQEAGTGSIWDV